MALFDGFRSRRNRSKIGEKSASPRVAPRRLGIMALEPRIMYDAAAAATVNAAAQTHQDGAADPAAAGAAPDKQAAPASNTGAPTVTNDSHSPAPAANVQTPPAPASTTDTVQAESSRDASSTASAGTAAPREVVFIDPQSADLMNLYAGAKDGDLVFVLDPSRDGVQQIADILAAQNLHDLDAIHIVSHGVEGQVRLGTTVLSENNLNDHAAALAAIGAALNADGDILLYGCDVAAGADGAQFIADLARLTGADIAASTDDTGSADLGGNWTLEASTGAIAATMPFTDAALASYEGLLAVSVTHAATDPIGQINGGIAEARMISGDFDRDGDMDFLFQASNAAGSGFGYLRSNGDGTYTKFLQGNWAGTPFATTDFTGQQMTAMFVGDYDGDGDVDIIDRDPSGGMGVWRNDNGAFVRVAADPIGQINNGLAEGRMVAGDFDGDGDMDFLYQAGNTAGSGFGYLRSNGNGTYTKFTPGNLAGTPFATTDFTGQQLTALFVGDYDGDGDVDIVDRDPAGGGMGVWRNNNGSFVRVADPIGQINAGVAEGRMIAGDFDSDGDMDFLYQAGNTAGSGFGYLRSNGDGTYTKFVPGSLAGTPFATTDFTGQQLNSTAMFVGDYDGDRDVDIVDRDVAGGMGVFVQGSNSGGDGHPPRLVSSTPADNSTGVLPGVNITLTFSESVTRGSGNIYIVRTSDNTVVETISVNSAQIVSSGGGTSWTIDPSITLAGGTSYAVRADARTFIDSDGAVFFGIKDNTTLNFKTASPPVLTLGGSGTPTYTEQGTPASALDGSLHITAVDTDNTQLAGATISISNAQAGDKLFYNGTLPAGITVSGSSTDTSLVLIGAANLAAYEQAFEQIIFSSTSDNPTNYGPATSRTLNYVVTDGVASSNSVSTSISVAAVNDAPVNHVPGAATFFEDTSGAIAGVSVTDVDSNPSVDGIQVVLSVQHGTLTVLTAAGVTIAGNNSATVTLTGTQNAINAALAAANGLTYLGALNYNGADTLTVTTDDKGRSGTPGALQAVDTVAITVNAVNDAPSGANTTVTTLQGTAYTFTAGNFGFTDPADGGANALLSVKITTLPTNGTLFDNGVAVVVGTDISLADIAGGKLSFVPTGNGNAYASFTFQVRDDGGTANGGVNLDPTPNTITVNVTPVALAPSGADRTVTGLEDTAYTFTTADFPFTDTDGNTLASVIIAALPPAGSLLYNGVAVTAGQEIAAADIAGGLLKFIPAANANGAGYASFTFQVRDNGSTANGGINLDASPNTLTVNVTAVNDAPQGADKTVSTFEDTAHVFTTDDFGFSDSTDGGANSLASVKISTLPTNGTLLNNGVAVIAGADISLADVLAGRLTFVPAANANGNAYAAFTFQVRDNGGVANGGVDLDASPNTITLNVTAVNDAPTGADKAVTTPEDTPHIFTTGDFGFADPTDGGANALAAVRISTLPANGALLYNGVAVSAGQEVTAADIAAGLLRFVPAANANGAAYAAFTFQVRDDGGTANGGVDLDASPNTITFNVTAVNDAPAGADKAVTTFEGSTYTFATTDFGFSDPTDGGANTLASVVIATLPTNGALLYNGGAISAGFEISLADLNGGLLRFVPAAGASGSAYASFTFQVRDNGGTANGGVNLDPSANTFTVNVTPINHAPSGADTTVTTAEDAAYTFGTSDFGFSDPADSSPNAPLSVKISTLPANGTLLYNGAAIVAGTEISFADITGGLLKFVPAANANGNAYASFTFQVRDNGGTTGGGVDLDPSPNTITVTVTPVNDAPVLGNVATAAAYTENAAAVTLSSGLTISDIDGPASGSATVSISGGVTGDQLLVFDPATGLSRTSGTFTGTSIAYNYDSGSGVMTLTGTDTLANYQAVMRHVQFASTSDDPTHAGGNTMRVISWQVTDSGTPNAASAIQTTTLTITPLNDAPAGTDGSVTTLEDTGYVFHATDFGFTDPADGGVNALLSVKISTLPATGQLLYNNVAVTQGQEITAADIGNGLLKFVPAANANGAANAAFTFQVRDDGGTGGGGVDLDPSPNTITINVTAVNDAPAVTASGGTTTFTEGNNVTSTPVAIDPGLTATDIDNTTLASAVVKIDPAGYRAGEDVLAFTGGAAFGNIAGNFDAATGELMLTSTGGTATVAQWQAALRSVTYTDTSDTPNTASRSISFIVNDGTDDSAVAAKTVTVVAVNDAPVNHIGTPGFSVTETNNLAITGLSVTDADADAGASPVSVQLVLSNSAAGTLTVAPAAGVVVVNGGTSHVTLAGTLNDINAALAAMNGVIFNAASGFIGNVMLSIVSNDGGASGGPAAGDTDTLTIAVNPANARPVVDLDANDSSAATGSNYQTRFTIGGAGVAIADPDVTITDGDDTLMGSATITLTTRPDGVDEGLSLNAAATTAAANAVLSVTAYNSSTGVLTITGSASKAVYQSILAGVIYSDTASSVTAGNRSVTVTVTDAHNAANSTSVAATTTIEVTANHAPVITSTAATLTIAETDAALTANGTVTWTDADGADTPTASIFAQTTTSSGFTLTAGQAAALKTAFTIDSTGHWSFNLPAGDSQFLSAGQSMTLTVTIRIDDGHNLTPGQFQDQKITITGTNDGAVITGANSGAVTEDVAVTGGNITTGGALTATDADQGQSNFTPQASKAGSNGYGTFTLDAAGNWTYTADNSQTAIQQLAAGAILIDTFTALSSDGSASQLVTVTINGTNDIAMIAGTLIRDLTEDVAVSSNTITTSGALTVTDADQGQSNFAPQASAAGSNHYGTFTLDAAGNWTYTADNTQTAIQQLASGATLTDSFTAVSRDGSASQIVTVTVHGTNDLPAIFGVFVGDVTEDVALTGSNITASGALGITDADQGQASFAAQPAVAGSYGTFTLDAAGTWTYSADNSQPAIQQLAAGTSLTDSFTAVSSDGSASRIVTVTIHGTNDVPVIAGTSAGSVTEDVAVNAGNLNASGVLTATDADQGQSNFTAQAGTHGLYGTFTVGANGAWTYTADNSQAAIQQLATGSNLADTFTVFSSDGTASKVVTVTINGTDDVAVIGGTGTGDVTEDVGLSGSNLATSGALTVSDADFNQSQFTAQSSTQGSNHLGTFTLDAAGTWTYTADNSQATIQQLASGATLTDSFTAVSSDGSASRVVTVTIHGTNDIPAISGTAIGDVTEDVAVAAGHITATGALTAIDADQGQSNFTAQAVTAGSNGYGTFTLGTNGVWTYTADNSQPAIQQLSSSATLTDSFTAVSSDGSASQVVTVTIHGTNDVAVIGGIGTGSVTEDVAVTGGNIAAGGALTVTDADAGQSNFTAQASAAGSHGFGTFTLGTNGAWTYTADNSQTAIQQLASGATLTDSFTAVSSDGSASQVVTVTIHGTNDVAVIGGTDTGSVTEDVAVTGGKITTSGVLTVADADAGQSNFVVQAAAAGSNNYGILTMGANGAWTYTADNTQAAVQQLSSGASLTDSFLAVSGDGSASKLVTVTIHGTNDGPVAVADSASVKEDTAPNPVTGNVLSNDSDVDGNDSHSVTGVTGSGTSTDDGTTITTVGTYGTLVLTKATGAYSYTLDNSKVQGLTEGQLVTEAFTYTDADNHGGSASALLTINITGTNDAPVLSSVAPSAAFTPGGPAVALSPTLSVADADDGATLVGATVRVSAGTFVGDGDILSVNGVTNGTIGNIQFSYNAGTETLTLTGTDTLANYQHILGLVQFQSTSFDPTDSGNHSSRTITWQLDDGSGAANHLSAAVTSKVFLHTLDLDGNNSSAVPGTGFAATYTESGAAVPVADVDVVIGDSDSSVMQSATITLTNARQNDALAINGTLPAGISVSSYVVDSVNGTITLTLGGLASTADYQSALHQVVFSSTSTNIDTTNRVISIVVTDDGGIATNPAQAIISIVAVNDPPVLEAHGGGLAYTENDSATAIDPQLMLSDLDSTNIQGATVKITGNLHAGEDVLDFVNQNGISGSYDAASGTLTLTGLSSVANYEAALRSVTYFNTSDNPSAQNRTISYRAVDDGGASSPVVTATVSVTPVNDAPLLSGLTPNIGYTENASPVGLSPGILLADLDGTLMTGAKVSIFDGFFAGDTLAAVTAGTGINASYDSASGVLTLSGQDTLAHYQQVLASITFVSTSDNPDNYGTQPTRTILWSITDLDQTSAAHANESTIATTTIDVIAVNDAPTVDTHGGALGYTENDAATAIAPSLTLVDLDSLTLTGASVQISGNFHAGEDILAFTAQNGISGSFDAATGVLTLTGVSSVSNYEAALRSVTYLNSSENPSGQARTISYVVADDVGAASAVATATVVVTPVNDAPVISSGNVLAFDVNNGRDVALYPAITIHDVDSTTLASAQVSIAGGFDPISDRLGFINQNGITGSYDSATGILTLRGVASLADYQVALASVTFNSTAQGDGVRSIAWTVDDGSSQFSQSLPRGTTTVVNVTGLIAPPHMFVDNSVRPATPFATPAALAFDTTRASLVPVGDDVGAGRAGFSYHIVHTDAVLTTAADYNVQIKLALAALEAPLGGDVVYVSARLANGDPLPDWLRFDPTNGTFAGLPPDGMLASIEGDAFSDDIATGALPPNPDLGIAPTPVGPAARTITIQVQARDSSGNIAVTTFTIDLRPRPGKQGWNMDWHIRPVGGERHAGLPMISPELAAIEAAVRDAIRPAEPLSLRIGPHRRGEAIAVSGGDVAAPGRAGLTEQLASIGWRSMDAQRNALLASLQQTR